MCSGYWAAGPLLWDASRWIKSHDFTLKMPWLKHKRLKFFTRSNATELDQTAAANKSPYVFLFFFYQRVYLSCFTFFKTETEIWILFTLLEEQKKLVFRGRRGCSFSIWLRQRGVQNMKKNRCQVSLLFNKYFFYLLWKKPSLKFWIKSFNSTMWEAGKRERGILCGVSGKRRMDTCCSL